MLVRRNYFARVLDRAAVVFCARRNFSHESDGTASIGTVGAVQLFLSVEVGKVLPV